MNKHLQKNPLYSTFSLQV